MKNILSLFASLFLFIALTSNAQDNRFSKVIYNQFGGSHVQASVLAGTDSLLIVGGPIGGIHLIDGTGNVLWSKSLGFIIPKDIIQTSDGHFVLTADGVESAALLVKFNKQGAILWTKKYQNDWISLVSGLFEAANGDILLTGSSLESIVPYSRRTLLLRFSPEGTLLFGKTYSAEGGQDEGKAIVETQNGDILIGGITKGNSTWASEIAILKTDAAGNLLWAKKKTSENPSAYSSLIDLFYNNLLHFSSNQNDASAVVTAMDEEGNIVHSKSYDVYGEWNDPGYRPRIRKNASGALLVNYSSLFTDGAIIAIDATGEPLWHQYTWMAQYDAHQLSDGGYFLVGNGPLMGVKDVTEPQIGIIRTNANGDGISCTEPWGNIPATDYPIDFVDITYETFSTGTATDYTLETTDATLNSFEGCVTFIGNTSEKSEQTNRLTIYPNPGTGLFYLDAEEIRAEAAATLKVYDSRGSLICQKTGSWDKLQILQIDLQPGMYLIQIFAEDRYFVNKALVSAR